MNARAAAVLDLCRRHLGFGITALACVIAFAWVVTFGTFSLVAEDSFGSFYDHQAAAWLKGRWDVPEPALQGEAFIVNGKVYGYFGPTPALFRTPLVALGIGFASTTRVWMLLHFVSSVVAAYALFMLALRWRNSNANPGTWAASIFTATIGIGSTLFFLSSRAYVYHEAILCGAAFALWSVYCALRFFQVPANRWWIGALVCGVLSVQARAPTGLFALLVLGIIALWHLVQHFRSGARKSAARFGAIGGMAAAGLLSFNLISYVKFGTIEGCPLRYNVQYNAEKLAALDHRNFHFSNLRFNTDTYLRRPIFGLRAEFPYIYREFINRREYPESRIAYRDPVLAIPWAMPTLFALAIAGSVLACSLNSSVRVPLGLVWTAGLIAALAMLTAVAVTHRYTADFVPFLVVAAAFGLVAVENIPAHLQFLARSALTLCTIVATATTLAITLHNQGHEVWGVPEEVRVKYEAMRRAVDAAFRHLGR
jgi:hypothetical protein